MLNQLGENACRAKRFLAKAGTNEKNEALFAIAKQLRERCAEILAANEKDIENAKANAMPQGMIDRLLLNEERVEGMASGVEQVANLDDPVGKTVAGYKRPNGLEIHKVTVPLGVIAIIYESRPNVTADAAALCLKSGNAVILRGGKEAINSNIAISEIMRDAVESCSFDRDVIQLVHDTSRDSANELMRMTDYVDVLIPRGGASLIKAVVQNSSVPIIETGTGNCHVYVDKYADLDMAVNVLFNAKTSRISVCNSCESLVVHKDVAEKFLPMAKAKLDTKNVEMRGDETACSILGYITPASEEDFAMEYLDYIISVKVVDSLDDAIEHINKYSTGHSESIITNDYNSSRKFMAEVDSAAVYVNASTRFTDGGEFGEGAEIGISTQKLHARGPMGLNQLTSVKFLIFGNGQIR